MKKIKLTYPILVALLLLSIFFGFTLGKAYIIHNAQITTDNQYNYLSIDNEVFYYDK